MEAMTSFLVSYGLSPFPLSQTDPLPDINTS